MRQAPTPAVLETRRLRLRRLTPEDDVFILRLLNEPSFLQYIGDKGVRTLADAKAYIERGPMASYAALGFGLYLVELRESGAPIGICGLLKRETLRDVDLGYAFVPESWAQGYAGEAAAGVLDLGRSAFALRRVAAVTNEDNAASIRVLEKLGFRYERPVKLSEAQRPSKLFCVDLGEQPELRGLAPAGSDPGGSDPGR